MHQLSDTLWVGHIGDARDFPSIHAAEIAALRENVPTLIYCSGGMSRSIAIASAALATVRRISPEAALQQVSQVAKSDVSPGLWNELRAAFRVDQVQ